ncbi:hypothetical protein M0805_004112 [Coniferiporia weirii]|nr:hypothetical protein M0805_004112 [Coniferiporia weirii]
MVPLIQITADEVNHIVYSYLQDSGFLHTAFTLRTEGRLEQSTHFNDYIPRGELVELLTKALLYTEVETHCKGDGLIMDCKTPFSLLKRHVCTVDELDDMVTGAVDKAGKSNGVVETPLKRKADMPAEGDVQDRRVKRSLEPEAVDTTSPIVAQRERLVTPNSERDASPMSGVQSVERLNGGIARKPKPRTESGPGDDKTSSKAILLLSGHDAEVFVCAWNPKKHGLIATGSKDATVRIWNLPDAPEDPSLFAPAPTDPAIVLKHLPDTDQRDITSLDWNVDGTLLATGSFDSILRVWTVNGGFYMSHPQHQGPIFATRFSKSGRWLLSASLDGTACVWDVAEKKLFMQFRCHTEYCLDVEWLDDSIFASCGADKLIHIMQIENPNPLRTFEGHENEINQIKFNPARTRLASCSDDRTARIWVVGDLSGLAAGSSDPILPQKDDVVVLEGHSDSIGGIGWCPNIPEGSHEILATTSFDGSARLWDASTGECLKYIADHKRAAYTLAFSPEGKFFATGSGDGWLYVYDVASGKQVWSWYAGPDKPGIYEIDWHQTGKTNRIAMCLETRAVGIIDVTRVPALMTAAA